MIELRRRLAGFFSGLWKSLRTLGDAWDQYECGSLCAACAYYGAVSLFPMLLFLVSALGVFLEFFQTGQSARDQILKTVSEQFSPQMADALAGVLDSVQKGALVSGPIALAGFLFVGLLGFAQLDRGFDRIWEVRQALKPGFLRSVRRFLKNRMRSLVLLLGFGTLVLIVSATGVLMHAAKDIATALWPEADGWHGPPPLLISFPLNVLMFAAVFRFLSKRTVLWRDCFMGGLLSASLWEGGRRVLAGMVIADRYTTYGIVGSFLAVIIWIYYVVAVVYIGALVVRLRYDRREALAQAGEELPG